VLVGTVSVDVSETLSKLLKRRGIPHSVLNAKYHKQEAEIVAKAGLPGAVTIATNMAGRGTDIKLGAGVTDARTVEWLRAKSVDVDSVLASPDPVRAIEEGKYGEDTLVEVGGLHIIGSERHESRRIDRQLRGRAGRQGDPGASQFFLSLEDDLMRLFNSERVAGIMERLGAQEGEVITHALVTRSIGSAQKRVEMQNFEARKRLLEYDDVMNQQREVIYDRRLFALEGGEDLKAEVWDNIENAVRGMVKEFAPEDARAEDWDFAGLRNRLLLELSVIVDELPRENNADAEPPFMDRDAMQTAVLGRVRDTFKRKVASFGEHQDGVLSYVLLNTIDQKWRDHLYDLDHLKASIGFRGWGQKDPLIEYKQEAYSMFVDLMSDIRKQVASLTFRMQVTVQRPPLPPPPAKKLILTGPGDGGGALRGLEPRREAASAPQPEPEEVDALSAAFSGSQRVARATAPALAQAGPDVRKLQTSHGDGPAVKAAPIKVEPKVGRNDPCPCGSGKKYKKCHGMAE
jgi:preprotein translocase subunit SecA